MTSLMTVGVGGNSQAGKVAQVWLGWDRPVLHSTIDYLLDRYRSGNSWDMDHVLCVFTSSLAGRRLSELLAEKARELELVLRPPEILTIGNLPEKLYQAKDPFAGDLEQILCWTKVLKRMPAEILKPLLVEVPQQNSVEPWIELAGLLSSLHRELSSDLTLFADVAKKLKNDHALEAERWAVLAKIQRAYLDELHKSNLWDVQTARRYAIDKREPKTENDILVIGAVDLNRAQRCFLDSVADHVTILTGAPSSWKAAFDGFGTLNSSFWQLQPVQLAPEQLVNRTTANEAAEEVARQIAYLEDKFGFQEITIGMPDTSLDPLITERMARANVNARSIAGHSANQSSIIRLIQSISEYIDNGSLEAFSTVVRIPMVSSFVQRSTKVPANFIHWLDIYYQKTLMRSVNIVDWPEAPGKEIVLETIHCIDEWLKPLRSPTLLLKEWAPKLREVLSTVFEDIVVDTDTEEGDSLLFTTRLVSNAIELLSDIPDELQIETTLRESIGWIVRQLDKQIIPPIEDPNSIEMIGWLDLPLDDAPVLILTGIHDGTVPESVNGDAFLPNEIRRELGLMDNARRYARDSYSMHVCLNTREHVRVITNHYSIQGEPLTPSRLLLAVNPAELAKRVMSLIKPINGKDTLRQVAGRAKPRHPQSYLPIPKPKRDAASAITYLSPSDFASYINCPYRFYLEKILGLSIIDDRKRELEANDFGNLLHDTLAELQGAPVESSTDEADVRKWLFTKVNEIAEKHYGKQPSSIIRIQLEQARQRLAFYATMHVERIKQGWNIWKTEVSVGTDAGVGLKIDKFVMPIIGRIDRIDYHADTGKYAIWDYKTGDAAKKPLPAHWSKSLGWKQLQLPLYQLMAPALGIPNEVSVGYIILPRSSSSAGFFEADFTDELFLSAIETAKEIVKKIRQNHFWPPRYDNLSSWDIYSGICQNNVARRFDEGLENNFTPDSKESGSPHGMNLNDVQRDDKAGLVVSLGLDTERKKNLARLAAIRSSESSHLSNKQLEVTQRRKANKNAFSLITKRNDQPPSPLSIELDSTAGKAPDEWYTPHLIEASAGTGKTFNLAIRVIRLLFAGHSAEGILATTFTRKAAGEILERVLELIADAIESPDGLDKLAKQLKPLKINRQACIAHLATLCNNLHRLRVATLDGFYAQLARTFALELNLPPGWRLADEFESNQMSDFAINQMFENQDHGQLRSLVSQLTKGESQRSVRQEVIQTVESAYYLFRTTETEAWSNLEVPTQPEDSVVEAAIARASESVTGDKRYVTARDKMIATFLQEDWSGYLGATLVQKALKNESYYNKPLPAALLEAFPILNQYALSKALAVAREQTKAAHTLLANYHLQLEMVKASRRVITFADVALRLRDWFKTKEVRLQGETEATDGKKKLKQQSLLPELDADQTMERSQHLSQIDYRSDARIDHLLLDEFQDTSPGQWDILKPFAEAVTRSRLGQPTSFFCVGDVKQAIYGWRGGVAELFKVVKEQLLGVRQSSLDVSFRSSPVVIDFVNRVFKNLPMHGNFGDAEEAAKIFSGAFKEHETAKQSMPGYIQLMNLPKVNEESTDGYDEEEDLSSIAVKECVRDVVNLHQSSPRTTIGILVRTNAELGPLMHALREKGVDASQEGGNPLTDSAAVELILSAVHLADHPGDRVAYFHLMNSPLTDFSKWIADAWNGGRANQTVDVESLSDEGESLVSSKAGGDESTSEDDTVKRTESRFYRDCYDEMHAVNVSRSIRSHLESHGFGRTIAIFAEQLSPYCNSRDQQRLDQLIQSAYRYEGISSLRNRDFVDFIRSDRVALSKPVSVRLMTIHQSKGLEFDAVFLPGLYKRFVSNKSARFVTSQSNPLAPPIAVLRYVSSDIQSFLSDEWKQAFQQQSIRSYTESLCMFYVALTRAKQALYMYATPCKRPVQSYDSLLLSILVPKDKWEAENEIVYREGDQEWFARAESLSIDSSNDTIIEQDEADPLLINLREYEPGDFLRQRSTVKPSAVQEDHYVSLKNSFKTSESAGALIGTIVHRWFEEVGWIEDFQWNRKRMQEMALQLLAPQEMPLVPMQRTLTSMEEYLSSDFIRTVLSKDRYRDWTDTQGDLLELSVSNERRLLELIDGCLLRGTIDRLVLGCDANGICRAEIIDYKTDAIDTKLTLAAWIKNRVEHHAPQLHLYRRVLAQQFGINPGNIQLTLVLLNSQSIVTVP